MVDKKDVINNIINCFMEDIEHAKRLLMDAFSFLYVEPETITLDEKVK